MKRFVVAAACLLSAGCNKADEGSNSAVEYKIVEDGGPETRDERTYDSLGDRTFTRVQKYKIIAQGDAGKSFHMLIAGIKLNVGSKTVSTVDAAFFPIVDGVHTFECGHNYDVKLTADVNALSDPACKFELRGVLVPSGKATLQKTP